MRLPVRDEALEELQRDTYDVLVIGGGITGAGVAMDAASRGLRVALVERRDYASGTSRWSTKLVHGGIRYLPQLDIGLVHEALVERGLLLRNAPRLVEPLLFVLPLYRFLRHPLGLRWVPPHPLLQTLFVRTGLLTYDLLAGRHNIGRHRRLSTEQVSEMVPVLRRDGLAAAFGYYDARTDDARLVLNVLATAAAYGACVVNYCSVIGFERQDGRLTAAVVQDELTGKQFAIRARLFVNATGVWGEQLERLTGESPAVHIAPSKGVHLVLSRARFTMRDVAVIFPETADRRVLFLVPFGNIVILGTTDTGSGPLESPLPEDADVEYLLDHANQYLDTTLTRRDVISAYAGYRPLIRRGMVETTAQLSRSHELIEHENGLISILGGKLTTFRRMAEETVDVVERRLGRSPRHVTAQLPLAGRHDLERVVGDVTRQAAALGLEASIPWLLCAYGTAARDVLELATQDPALARPIVDGLPYLLAEVVYACRFEQVQHIDDLLERRTFLAFVDWHHGLQSLETVSMIMARALHWSDVQRVSEVARFRHRVQELFGAEYGIAAELRAARAALHTGGGSG